MSEQLKNLMFSIGMVDNVTEPVNRINRELESTASRAQTAFAEIGGGFAAMVGAGLALQSLLSPALELDNALRALGSNAAPDVVKHIGDAAVDMSSQFSQSAVEIVEAAKAINTQVKGLSAADLDAFTQATTVLATTTKTDLAETSKYITQMYARYKDTADAMGKADWVEQLVGRTDYLRKNFGTSMEDLHGAMEGLNNLGSGVGVSMTEQLAVMATLNQSTGIGDAEAQYTNFLEQAFAVQEKLGMSFTDTAGNLLPVTQIIDMLTTKFGDLSGVKTWAVLDDAFGDGSKMLQQLSKDTKGLAKTMADLEKIKGIDGASKAAADMVDPWTRLSKGIEAVSLSVGTALLPIINPIVDSFARGAAQVAKWTRMFPNLTKVVGLGVVGILGITAALGAFAMLSGIASIAMIGYGSAMATVNSITTALKAGMASFRAVMLAVNIAMYANPVGFLVAGIAVLITAVSAVAYYWEDLKKAFMDTSWGEGLTNLIGGLIQWFEDLGTIAGETVDWVIDKINLIPGIEIGGGDEAEAPRNTVNQQLKTPAIQPGQVTSSISKAITQSQSTSRVNHTTINTTQAPTPQLMDSWFAMEAF